jgi:hypothetical protein
VIRFCGHQHLSLGRVEVAQQNVIQWEAEKCSAGIRVKSHAGQIMTPLYRLQNPYPLNIPGIEIPRSAAQAPARSPAIAE